MKINFAYPKKMQALYWQKIPARSRDFLIYMACNQLHASVRNKGDFMG